MFFSSRDWRSTQSLIIYVPTMYPLVFGQNILAKPRTYLNTHKYGSVCKTKTYLPPEKKLHNSTNNKGSSSPREASVNGNDSGKENQQRREWKLALENVLVGFRRGWCHELHGGTILSQQLLWFIYFITNSSRVLWCDRWLAYVHLYQKASGKDLAVFVRLTVHQRNRNMLRLRENAAFLLSNLR